MACPDPMGLLRLLSLLFRDTSVRSKAAALTNNLKVRILLPAYSNSMRKAPRPTLHAVISVRSTARYTPNMPINSLQLLIVALAVMEVWPIRKACIRKTSDCGNRLINHDIVFVCASRSETAWQSIKDLAVQCALHVEGAPLRLQYCSLAYA